MNGSNKRTGSNRSLVLLSAVAGACLVVAACGAPAPVVQGPIVSVDAKTISLQDEMRPEGPPVVLDISTAEIGGRSAVGDVVRVVYRAEGGVNRALAVMNLNRQSGQ